MKSEPTPSDGEVLTGLAQHPICCCRSRVDLSVRLDEPNRAFEGFKPNLGKVFRSPSMRQPERTSGPTDSMARCKISSTAVFEIRRARG
jgi:hypothetical protein